MKKSEKIPNSKKIHLQLGDKFYRRVKPARFPSHKLRYRNQDAAEQIGLGDLDPDSWENHFAKFSPFENSLPEPVALCYHGHQFGHYNPDLGDGRGFLFAQFVDKSRNLLDLGTKGSGTTPFSRGADGRLTLKGAVREILATEMLEALGVSTSRTFSVFETGELLQRNDEPSPTRSAVLVRLSHSHIRIGTFQRFHYLDDMEAIEVLARHVVHYYYSEDSDYGSGLNSGAKMSDLLPELFGRIVLRVAATVGEWLAAGFVHGVLNTDNFNITGESFDYGPWRFLNKFDPNFTAAYFDEGGRYAYGRQAEAALWALCRLADCFLKITEKRYFEDRLVDFYPEVEKTLAKKIKWRLGITFESEDQKRDEEIARQFFIAANKSQLNFDQIFHDLYGGKTNVDGYGNELWKPLMTILADPSSRAMKGASYKHFQSELALCLTIDEVESLWEPIAARNDWTLLQKKVSTIRDMRSALHAEDKSPMPQVIGGSMSSKIDQ